MNEALKSSSGYRSQIRISRNVKYVSKIDYLPEYCNIVKQSIPYYYVVDGIGIGRDFKGSVDFIVDKRVSELDKAFICETESNPAAIPELTSIVYDCAAAKILECRAFYQPIQSCGAPWKSIPDDTISIHVYALFMNLKASCKLSDVDLKTVQALIECISSLDIDCPLAKAVQESETPTTPSPFNSLLTQMKTISSMTQSLHGFFPALSTLESQLIDFPNYMADFLHHFELTFPSSDFNNIRSQSWFDSFYSVISDNSELGPAITFSELETFQSWKDGKNLIFRWNETFEELKGEEFELISPESKESRILLIRKLIEKADKLKSLARQFAAKEPFTMLHDILATIFGRVDYTSSNATEECAKAIGFVEPGKLRESEEFEVSIVITNVMYTQVLQNLRFQLEMLHSTPTGYYSFIKYRIGPLFYSGGIPSYLPPQKTLTVSWKIHPVFDRRLTEAIKEQPNVILTFDLNNKRKIQRIRIPEITILPDRHLRVYALAFQDVFPRTSESQPFSLSLHVMNSGFSTLKNLEFVEISPWLMDKQKQGHANFRINSVSIDSKFVGYLPKVSIKEIQSGKTSIISINLTSLGGQSAKFKNCSVSVFVDGQNFPEHFDYKFFYVQEIVSSSTYILSDKEPQNYKANLFYFNPKSSQIRNLHQIQLIEEIPSEDQQESKSYYTILATFERLLSPEEMAEAASAEGLKQTESTIYGRIQYPENLKKGQKLVRIYEIGPGGIRRHLLDLNNTWIAKKGDVSELNFIDPQALPPALASQLSYEFIFAKSEDFNTPYFGQHFYREQIPENMIIQPLTVIGKVGAHSPEGSKVNYSLVSQDKTENFVINTKTDSNGRKSAVPYEILLPSNNNNNSNLEKQKCAVFQTDTPITYHEFTGDRSKLKRIQFGNITTTTEFPTSNIGEEVTISTNNEFSEITATTFALTSKGGGGTSATMISDFETSSINPTADTATIDKNTGDYYTIQSTPTSETWGQTRITDDDRPSTSITLPIQATNPTRIYTLPTEDYSPELTTTQAVRLRTTPKIIHEIGPDDYPKSTTKASETVNTVADWYTEDNAMTSDGEVTVGQSSATMFVSMPPPTRSPPTTPSMSFTQFYTLRPTITIPKYFPTPPLFTPKPPTSSEKNTIGNIFINYMSTTIPPTVSPLPIATRMSLYTTPFTASTDLLGQVSSSGFMTIEQPVDDMSASMVDTACRLRTTKPIWAVVCDMAKTVKVNDGLSTASEGQT
uniref:Uncharacterized protein n=1 Tax=Panagrolaimus davidi TaxID=227884 RepID=A0A914PN56_9BILA